MLALPIISTFGLLFGLIESCGALNNSFFSLDEFLAIEETGEPLVEPLIWSDFFSSVDDFLAIEEAKTPPFEPLTWLPDTFILFCLLHLLLGIALLQHTHRLKAGERAKVLWFGLYALDWKPMDFISPTKPEAVAIASVDSSKKPNGR